MTEQEAICFAIEIIEEAINNCPCSDEPLDFHIEAVECLKTLDELLEEEYVEMA